ncbi:ATP-binding response regulator [Bacteroides cellulosilyticus]|uniref:ATP-binding response regulator n=1 Tax=Bacteroides cellulosilyticus TaxID=246787 RepID=UPI001C377AF8|nr:ATP-binding protein [Bacteroides cellulosilyticus]MBV3638358.1 response regulator [Bacteroides cellulosilyticus]MBV3664624.1 response regulator [Bacteroides cellulosilyticus]MBV3686609.1 response regulator [Bacteroides cellulosilyticus]MBV3695306.1 response regulator [Bacteroides cellulosilyticus]MBV3708970.1 response regulator [Bacteroides cellulosilyticus]
MNNVSKKKIAAGYAVLLAVLLYSLFFVHREMENLMSSDNTDILRTDSLIGLLREKDANTVRLLRTLSEANDSMISAREVEQIIAEQDTIITQQRVQRRVIARRDTVVTQPKKKGFFRRLGEVFVPPRKDSAVQVQTTLEVATDTVLDAYNPVDSLHAKLRTVARQKKATNSVMQRRKRTLQRLDHALSARIDSLLKGYEQETLMRAREEAEYQKAVRHRSATIISGIAAGAVVLSVIFLVMIWRDVTRSNRYRHQLEEANRFAEELLASREKLMLAITHDFKAPLGSIMGYADLLSRLTVDGRQRFYLDNMKTSSEHLLKLVTDLLDFHRLDLNKAEINRVTFHPARLLEEIYVSFEPLTSAKGLSLKCEIDPELKGAFISDPLRLRQIVNNLLSNAVKFTSEGGITLTASFVPKGDSAFPGNHLKLSVIDTGKGMEPGDRERIFQEFTRLPGAQGEEGFGLGLSIVRMLVQLLEGRIEVDSALGKGSTFTLRVPLYPVALDNDTSALNEQPSDDSQTQIPALHILLIDDDRIQLTLTAAMLAQSGITSVTCLQLDELLEALRTDTFDVLLTDVQMPAMNGFDLLNLLRASNIPQAKTIPVVAVTARSDMKREEFLQHGFAGSLHKPFTVNELLTEIGVLQADIATVDTAPSSALNFSALTAFSGDDPDAAKSILESFVVETRLNVDRLRQALETEDTDGIAAMGHKMLPLFTLLGASELVTLLKELEASRGVPFDEKIKEKSLAALRLIGDILEQAAKKV